MRLKTETLGERIKRIRGEEYQSDFGKRLGVSQGTVSAWEKDDKQRLPSADMYFRLAMLASNPDDQAFFLQGAGLSREIIVSAANKIASEQVVRPKEGDVVRLEPLRQGEPTLELSAGLISGDPVFMKCFEIKGYAKAYKQSHKDIFIIDTSHADEPNLAAFWNQRVLVEYRPTPGSLEYMVGELSLRKGRQHGARVLYDAVLQPWAVDFCVIRKGGHELESDIHPGQFIIGGWWDVHAELSEEQRKRLGLSTPKEREAMPEHAARARVGAILHENVRILGIAIGWFRQPDTAK